MTALHCTQAKGLDIQTASNDNIYLIMTHGVDCNSVCHLVISRLQQVLNTLRLLYVASYRQ